VIAAIFVDPDGQGWLLPLFWFLAKTGAILFVFNLDFAATLPRPPLRPVDGLHLEVPVPRGHAEFAGDRICGSHGRQNKWT